MSMIRTLCGFSAMTLMVVGCSDHNPVSPLNPDSKAYVGDSLAKLDGNQDGIADILQVSSIATSSSEASSIASSSTGASSIAPSSMGVLSSVTASSSSSAIASSSSSTGLYTVTLNNGIIVATGLSTGSFARLTSITVQVNTDAQLGTCFDGWTSSDLNGMDLSAETLTFIMPNHDVTLSASVSSCSNEFSDKRDGKHYPYEAFDSLLWMMENVAYDAADSTDWCYANSTTNCTTYGRLYTWDAAQNACPTGWRLPTLAELRNHETLLNLQKAGNREKSGNFSQLSGMGFYWTSGPFATTYKSGDNPSNCTSESTCGVTWILNGSNHYAQRDSKALGFSVRCVTEQ